MKKQLYLDIVEHLKTITNSDGEALFQHFDLWNQQVAFLEEETPFNLPAVFVEFTPHTWQTLGNRKQAADLTVRLHIVTQWFSDTADYVPEEFMLQAVAYLDIIDKVVAAMQNFAPTNANSWMRTRSIPNHDHGRYVDSIEEYVCNIVDTSAVPQPQFITVNPVVIKE